MKKTMSIILSNCKSGHEVEIMSDFESTVDALFMLQELVEHVSQRTKVSADLLLELLQVGHGAHIVLHPDTIRKTDDDVAVALWKELEHRIEANMRASEE